MFQTKREEEVFYNKVGKALEHVAQRGGGCFMDVSSLETSKVRLDGALSNLI